MVGRMPCSQPPRMLKKSPSSQMTTNRIDSESALRRCHCSRIWGEKTTTQHAIEMELHVDSESVGVSVLDGRAVDHHTPADARDGLDVEVEDLRRRHGDVVLRHWARVCGFTKKKPR